MANVADKINHHYQLYVDDRPELYLRLISLDDIKELSQVIAEDREHLQQFQSWARTSNAVTSKEVIQRHLLKMEAGTWLQYRIMINDKMAGSVTLSRETAGSREANLSYWLAKTYEGKGYAFAAAQRFIEYGFKSMELDKICLIIDEKNARSEKLAQRLGAEWTGRNRVKQIDGKPKVCKIWEIING